METALKSHNIKTEMQAALPPLVMDALVQTDVVSQENEACQTEKSTGIDCEVQANPEIRTLCTQTIKQEIKTEIALPNTICSYRFGLKNAKKRKLSSIENSTQRACLTEKSTGTDSEVQADDEQKTEHINLKVAGQDGSVLQYKIRMVN